MVGEDITMVDVLTFSEREIVGHAHGQNLRFTLLKAWVSDKWGGQNTKSPRDNAASERLVHVPV